MSVGPNALIIKPWAIVFDGIRKLDRKISTVESRYLCFMVGWILLQSNKSFPKVGNVNTVKTARAHHQ